MNGATSADTTLAATSIGTARDPRSTLVGASQPVGTPRTDAFWPDAGVMRVANSCFSATPLGEVRPRAMVEGEEERNERVLRNDDVELVKDTESDDEK